MCQVPSKPMELASGCLEGAQEVLIAKLRTVRQDLHELQQLAAAGCVRVAREEGEPCCRWGCGWSTALRVCWASPPWDGSCLGSTVRRVFLEFVHPLELGLGLVVCPCQPSPACGWAALSSALRGWFCQPLASLFMWSKTVANNRVECVSAFVHPGECTHSNTAFAGGAWSVCPPLQEKVAE